MLNTPVVSVIIPTRNRPSQLAETLACIARQSLTRDAYEIIVVDDRSTPPVAGLDGTGLPECRLLRLEGVERSAARNAGAEAARGDLLVFLDDDMSVEAGFLEAHLQAHAEWPGALAVGRVRLPDEALRTPFGRFRQDLERAALPEGRGPTSQPNFCTAQNASIRRTDFLALQGFDPLLASAEDQDLALRHTARGGIIVFLPEAEAVHRDGNLDIRAYCRRTEWGAEATVAFCRRHPDWPENRDRALVNGPLRWGADPVRLSVRKVVKSALALRPLLEASFALTRLLEKGGADARILSLLYRPLLGIHMQRGYRRGRRLYGPGGKLANPGAAAAEIRS
jgi:GT2 family glycosyltransferase